MNGKYLSLLKLRNKTPQIEWFEQQKCASHSPGDWEVQDQELRSLVPGENSSWIAGHLLVVSPQEGES